MQASGCCVSYKSKSDLLSVRRFVYYYEIAKNPAQLCRYYPNTWFLHKVLLVARYLQLRNRYLMHADCRCFFLYIYLYFPGRNFRICGKINDHDGLSYYFEMVRLNCDTKKCHGCHGWHMWHRCWRCATCMLTDIVKKAHMFRFITKSAFCNIMSTNNKK